MFFQLKAECLVQQFFVQSGMPVASRAVCCVFWWAFLSYNPMVHSALGENVKCVAIFPVCHTCKCRVTHSSDSNGVCHAMKITMVESNSDMYPRLPMFVEVGFCVCVCVCVLLYLPRLYQLIHCSSHSCLSLHKVGELLTDSPYNYQYMHGQKFGCPRNRCFDCTHFLFLLPSRFMCHFPE